MALGVGGERLRFWEGGQGVNGADEGAGLVDEVPEPRGFVDPCDSALCCLKSFSVPWRMRVAVTGRRGALDERKEQLLADTTKILCLHCPTPKILLLCLPTPKYKDILPMPPHKLCFFLIYTLDQCYI